MKRVLLYIAALFLIAILYISCTESSVENKIDGNWKLIDMSNVNSSDSYTEWTILSGYIYMKSIQPGSTAYDTLNNGIYNIKIKRLSRYLCLSECSDYHWDGDYKITKLNSKYLVLVRDQDLLEMYEFTKK